MSRMFSEGCLDRSQEVLQAQCNQSQAVPTLAQIDACDFNPRPMLLYTFDESFDNGRAVCCRECAETDFLEDYFKDSCGRKRRKRKCSKPKPCCKSSRKRKKRGCKRRRKAKSRCRTKRKPRCCPRR
ncbi:uncharacterized protein LOC111592967 [Drosophila hydei]|uniref:Uncharacterized protein LOC111592967 n=1 Tax=Drosophila hydei TaxID=7224 RepID=A0A6J1LDF6_DROHY|nr:uncharacterized protein LOC111592967 [Drosophila hydei]